MKMYFQPDPCRRIEVAFKFKFGGLREKTIQSTAIHLGSINHRFRRNGNCYGRPIFMAENCCVYAIYFVKTTVLYTYAETGKKKERILRDLVDRIENSSRRYVMALEDINEVK